MKAMAKQQLANAAVKLQRAGYGLDPVSGFHAYDIIRYVMGIGEDNPSIAADCHAALRRAGFGEVIDA